MSSFAKSIQNTCEGVPPVNGTVLSAGVEPGDKCENTRRLPATVGAPKTSLESSLQTTRISPRPKVHELDFCVVKVTKPTVSPSGRKKGRVPRFHTLDGFDRQAA